jgi:hypothetical protein
MKHPSVPESLKSFTEEELTAELARRRSARGPTDMLAMEEGLEAAQQRDGAQVLRAYFERRSEEESDGPKRCPKCGSLVRVRAKNRSRPLQTVAGPQVLRRHYHYCAGCRYGFYPLDIELGLPEEGELTPKMEERILDFGVTTTFEEAAQRWCVHHQGTISENLVRRVVDRAGRKAEAAHDDDLQRAMRPVPSQPAGLLVVQTDGSMLPIRGPEPWKEAKLGVLFRDDKHLPSKPGCRGQITEARHVCVLGGREEFQRSLDAALRAERADEARAVAWVADGARYNWTMADEICPRAVQILDWIHAAEHGLDCGKILLDDDAHCLGVWAQRIKNLLFSGDICTLISELKACAVDSTQNQKAAIDSLVDYYQNNENRMRYREFRALGLPIGSGAVESGHRHVLQKRMKLAGQHWEHRRARRLVVLRACYTTAGPKRFYRAIREATEHSNELRRSA